MSLRPSYWPQGGFTCFCGGGVVALRCSQHFWLVRAILLPGSAPNKVNRGSGNSLCNVYYNPPRRLRLFLLLLPDAGGAFVSTSDSVTANGRHQGDTKTPPVEMYEQIKCARHM